MSETVPKKWEQELQAVLAEITRLEGEAVQLMTTWGRALAQLRERVQVLSAPPLSARAPAPPTPPEGGQVAAAPVSAEPRGRVLIIDDEAFILTVVRDRLQASGFEVLTAKNGTVGIEQAKKHHPDVIVLDVMMSGMDGYETCRRLKRDEATRGITIIMLTALDKDGLHIKASQAGADWTVTKALDTAKLINTIGFALQGRRRKAQ
jgi:CheY-like chemotaxis protein